MRGFDLRGVPRRVLSLIGGRGCGSQISRAGPLPGDGHVNVTEDSSSDGGANIDAAIAHGRELVEQGADMIDVGGESTRPGATRVDAGVEAARVAPVIAALAEEGIPTSVDTMRASVAAAAAEAGVHMINDVSGGLADTDMYRVMADTDLPVCLMHWRTVQFGDAAGQADHGGDVVADVRDTLARLVDNALAAGVARDNVVLDPGLGFAKSREDNWALLNHLPEFLAGEFPVLVGARASVPPGSAPTAARGCARGRRQKPPPPSPPSPPRWARGVRCTTCRLPRRRRRRRPVERGVPWLTTSNSPALSFGHHGVFDHEADGQPFIVDIVLAGASPAAPTTTAAHRQLRGLAQLAVEVVESRGTSSRRSPWR